MSRADIISLILSFICALLLWGYAKTVASPDEKTRDISGIPVILTGSSPSGYSCSLHPESRLVTIRFRGSNDTIDSLTPEDIKVKVNVDNITKPSTVVTLNKSNIEVPQGVHILRYPNVTLITEPLKQRKMPITVSFISQPPTGFVVGQYVINPTEVTIEGNKKAVDSVSFLQVRIDPNKKLESETQLPLHAVDELGNQVNDVRILTPVVIVHMVSLTTDIPKQ